MAEEKHGPVYFKKLAGLPVPATKAVELLACALARLNEAHEAICHVSGAIAEDEEPLWRSALADVRAARLNVENTLPHLVDAAARYAKELDE